MIRTKKKCFFCFFLTQGSYFYNDQTTPNIRLFTATGLAAIEIGQLFSDLWKSYSSSKSCTKQGEFGCVALKQNASMPV